MRTAVIGFVALCAASPCAAQLQGGPAIFRSGDEWTAGVRIRADYERRTMALLDARPWERALSFSAVVPVATHARRNPETLRGSAAYGWEKSLLRTEAGLEVREDDPIDPGFVRIQGMVEAEAPQTFDVATASAGAAIEYAHRTRAIFFIPNVRLAVTGTGCTQCTTDDAAAFFGRGQVDAGMTIPFALDAFPDALAPFEIRLAGRGFHTFGQPADTEADLRPSGLSGSAAAAWRQATRTGWWEVYLLWQDGDLPIRPVGHRAWTAGVTLAF